MSEQKQEQEQDQEQVYINRLVVELTDTLWDSTNLYEAVAARIEKNPIWSKAVRKYRVAMALGDDQGAVDEYNEKAFYPAFQEVMVEVHKHFG